MRSKSQRTHKRRRDDPLPQAKMSETSVVVVQLWPREQILPVRSYSLTFLSPWVFTSVVALLLVSGDCLVRKQRWIEVGQAHLPKNAGAWDPEAQAMVRLVENNKAGRARPASKLTSSRSDGLSLPWGPGSEDVLPQQMCDEKGMNGECHPLEPLVVPSMSLARRKPGNTVSSPPKDAPPAKADADILLACLSEWRVASTSLKTWVRENNCSTWFGVACNRTTRAVVSLNLFRAGISGPIPSQIGGLMSLSALDLSYNRLEGEISTSVGNLTNLMSLSLRSNILSGSLPSPLYKLKKITVLDLSNNRLAGSIPGAWGLLSNLVSLSLGCTADYYNSDRDCVDGSIPSSLSNLKKLKRMTIVNTYIGGTLPSWLGDLGSLEYLSIDTNGLRGTLPSSLGNLRKLTGLNIAITWITGPIPSSFGNLRSLSYLSLNWNDLNGTIPSSLWTLTNLTYLGLFRQYLAGPVPTAIGNLTNLQNLGMSFNLFNGSLPTSIARLNKLTYLDFRDNFIRGPIPWQWSALSSLKDLFLNSNFLTGPLPTSLGNLGQLGRIYLFDNLVTGTIPSQWSGLSNLTTLCAQNNLLSGTIPASLGNMKRLVWLDLSRNQLTGVVPSFLERVLLRFLSFNFFTGVEVPSCPRTPQLQRNCLPDNDCFQAQRTFAACQEFCNTTSPEGACGGRGTCAVSGPNNLPTCTCDPGFMVDPLNLGTCIPQEVTPPPPPPITGNQTLGLRFEALAPRRFLNRYSRYISFGFKVSNTVASWTLESAIPWMAPASIFITAGTGPPPEAGILNWEFVRNQGPCNSCWAEVATDSVASSLVLARIPSGGAVTRLSAPQILNCTNNSGRCQGDLPTNALDYIVQNGLISEDAFNNTCPAPQEAQGGSPQVLFYEAVQFRGWLGLLLTIQNQPAIITLEGSSRVFQQPLCATQGFILADPSCYSGSLDHSVLVVGYDLSGFTPYWVIRNSWGTEWCTQGYMRLGVLGGDGACGMNVLPAYYPIPAPKAGDPCFRDAIVPDGTPEGNPRPVMNPCGGGSCRPATDIDPYSYTCSCPRGFVAVNNSVDLAFPASRTQSCVPVDACGLSLSNPCNVGTCVNDGRGAYSCICPLGYLPGQFVDGNPTCTFVSSTIPPTATFTVSGLGVTCALIGATYNLTLPKLLELNPSLNCDLLTNGTVVNVSNPSYKCAIGYIATAGDSTCKAVLDRTVTDGSITVADLARLNIALNCSYIQKGQLVCLKGGVWPAEFVCTQFQAVTAFDTCASIAQRFFRRDQSLFYGFNPGIDCQALTTSLRSSEKPRGDTVCVGAEPVGTGNRCSPGFLYTLKTGENCNTLFRNKRGGFKSPVEPETYNKGKFNIKCNSCRQGTQLCTRQRVT